MVLRYFINYAGKLSRLSLSDVFHLVDIRYEQAVTSYGYGANNV